MVLNNYYKMSQYCNLNPTAEETAKNDMRFCPASSFHFANDVIKIERYDVSLEVVELY